MPDPTEPIWQVLLPLLRVVADHAGVGASEVRRLQLLHAFPRAQARAIRRFMVLNRDSIRIQADGEAQAAEGAEEEEERPKGLAGLLQRAAASETAKPAAATAPPAEAEWQGAAATEVMAPAAAACAGFASAGPAEPEAEPGDDEAIHEAVDAAMAAATAAAEADAGRGPRSASKAKATAQSDAEAAAHGRPARLSRWRMPSPLAMTAHAAASPALASSPAAASPASGLLVAFRRPAEAAPRVALDERPAAAAPSLLRLEGAAAHATCSPATPMESAAKAAPSVTLSALSALRERLAAKFSPARARSRGEGRVSRESRTPRV